MEMEMLKNIAPGGAIRCVARGRRHDYSSVCGATPRGAAVIIAKPRRKGYALTPSSTEMRQGYALTSLLYNKQKGGRSSLRPPCAHTLPF